MVSINGLICVYRLHHRASTELDKPVIFNLCTRESITLPHALNTSRSHYLVHSTWIGFSPQTNENKVLQVLVRHHHTNESSFIFKIFTLGGTSSSWRHLEIEDKDFDDLALDYQNLLFHQRSVFLHGARHWLETNIKDELVILVFDFEQERFRVIPLPQEYHKDRVGASPFVEMIEVNECVAINDPDFSSEGNVISLWILKDYQHLVWVKESIIFPTKWKKMGFPIPRCSIYTGELLLRGPCGTCERPDSEYLLGFHLASMEQSLTLFSKWVTSSSGLTR
ncbi:uncharacterized protein LOC112184567 [Rosa chinensis]|uniref:uncharacterized protein LOC112184567 n=1 Tax=Rosa chinensis TaxID=74649 RepID=UPI000D08786D|nr:uncharacterized protein LOC112184567 [Rosa chinensis]